jgi:hypothetical protein
VRVDWADPDTDVKGRKYIKIISGRIEPSAGEIMVYSLGEYKIKAGTVFDVKDNYVDYEVRYRAKQDFPIRKDGNSDIVNRQIFAKRLGVVVY